MKLDPKLAELRAGLSVTLPKCSVHSDRFAVAFCGHCGHPVCQDCLSVTPVEPRCEKCRPAAASLPAGGARLAGLLCGLASRRWAVGFMAATVVFVLVLLFLPGLLRARPPELVISGFTGVTLQAPYVEKACRLRTTGDMYVTANRQEKAQDCFRKALAAYRIHLEAEKRAPVRLQVELAIAGLQQKTGDADGAIATLQKVISDAAGGPATGVAQYYLGRVYELLLMDQAKALEQYQAAMKYADSSRGDPLGNLEKLLEYDDDKDGGGRTAYGIAGLTDTHVNATALYGEISDAIRRTAGTSIPSADLDTDGEEPPQVEVDDPLVIEKGK